MLIRALQLFVAAAILLAPTQGQLLALNMGCERVNHEPEHCKKQAFRGKDKRTANQVFLETFQSCAREATKMNSGCTSTKSSFRLTTWMMMFLEEEIFLDPRTA